MKTKISVLAVALALVAGLAWAGYTTLIYKDSGGNKMVVASSGVADMVTTGAADETSNTRIKVRINGTDYWLLATSAAPAP